MRHFILLSILLYTCIGLVWGQTVTPKAYTIAWQGHNYSVYIVDPAKQHIDIEQLPNGSTAYDFAYLKEHYDSTGKELLFAMNAGMFHQGKVPVGLLIKDGISLNPLVLNVDTTQRGNFYALPPNGVFWMDSTGKAQVSISERYPKLSAGKKVILATQSGPILVHDGKLNKAFNKGSKNLNIRNGVGVTASGLVVFVISDVEVNFYDMAALFRDKLHCNNALYLDGSISKMYLPAIGRNELNNSSHLGPVITVHQKQKD